MTKIRLEVGDDGEVLLRAEWSGGELRLWAMPDFRAMATKWAESGLSEWVGNPASDWGMYVDYDLMPRLTRAEDPEFMARLAAYMMRCHGLDVSLSIF